MYKKAFVILLFLLGVSLGTIQAQERITVRGAVMNKKTNEPVIGAAVHIKELEKWTVSDRDGNFVFENVIPRKYTIEVQCLCYEFYTYTIDVKPDETVYIDLVPTSYDMDEVNVLAKKGTDMSSSTKVGAAAIDHIQATGLGDIMQLMPGGVSLNPELHKAQQISIREIGSDVNSSMGTSIIVDNAPLSNDANLQSFSGSASGEFESVAGGGVDLRQISANNIESVEVIKGIPSVIYGDLTSGAVVVNTRAGYSPLNIRMKTDPRIKQVSFDKGFQLNNKNSFINANVDYLSSHRELTSKYEGYERVTGQISYSNTFLNATNPLSFNVKLSGFRTIDNLKTDPDAMTLEEEIESKDQGGRLNIYGKWNLDRKWISELKYTYSLSYTHQEGYEKKYRSQSVTGISTSKEEGENEGIYLPSEQLTELIVDGKPLNIFGQVTATKVLAFENGMLNKTLAGFDYRLNGNYGEGQIYDIENPPYISSASSRPRSFKEIPALQSYSVYLEDKFTLPIRSTKLSLQGGFRLNNFQSKNFINSEVGYYFEPRFNLQYNILNNKNNNVFKLLTLNAGIGKNYKAPSLLYLYPNDVYYDLNVLDYYVNDPAFNTVMFYTFQFNRENPELKPSESRKKEVGIDFSIGRIKGSFTAFSEKQYNGFSWRRIYRFVDAYAYDVSAVPSGEKPDVGTLPVDYFSYILGYTVPVNTKESDKTGIEFRLDFGKVKALQTSFTVDGAYLKTTRVYDTEDYEYLPSSGTPVQYAYIGMYPAGESKVSERLNTNLRMVTHIPQLRMIVSTTIQLTWLDKYYYPYYDESPDYLFNREGDVIDYTEEMKTNPDYIRYADVKQDFYWIVEDLPPLFVSNIKLSKEIDDKLQLSLFLNNFFNYRPLHQLDRTDGYTRRNETIYFGAEVKFKL